MSRGPTHGAPSHRCGLPPAARAASYLTQRPHGCARPASRCWPAWNRGAKRERPTLQTTLLAFTHTPAAQNQDVPGRRHSPEGDFVKYQILPPEVLKACFNVLKTRSADRQGKERWSTTLLSVVHRAWITLDAGLPRADARDWGVLWTRHWPCRRLERDQEQAGRWHILSLFTDWHRQG